ncbi:SRPBCC family protein [Amycolatopsis nigrescens]|uniref:SRPBCC family protein n=1 Tax=Amycolatopsis nigrescens TaxID=381445 RepID=UPI00037F5E6B|nr:SRPBCC family protein [Amycolatopsis nigrescens]
MSEIGTASTALFRLQAETHVSATSQRVYALVSDLARSGEWSAECTGGEWVAGRPGTVGAVFRGENRRAAEVVSWAPVVRGTWYTEAEIVTAEPGRSFGWAMRDSAGRRQDSVWSFTIEPDNAGVVLSHRFQMDQPTEGIRTITAEMDGDLRRKFFAEWAAKVERDLAATVRRVKNVAERN